MIHPFWRLSEDTKANLGPAITSEGLLLGRTPLIERCNGHFAVRAADEIALLLGNAYDADIAVDHLMSRLAVVAAALNANDPCLAHIAAVHLRLPDLQCEAARDNLEAADALIKYDDWNPALHPRAGTPPNPGWFAPTGGSDDASSGVEVAQNDDPKQRSDDSSSPVDNWVRLPIGPKRIDELTDFVEWLANATPADEQTIRAEIKRYFYDAGDQGSAAALNSALSVVLRAGVTQQVRQRILNSLDAYTRAEPGDYVGVRDLLTGGAIAIGTAGGAASDRAATGEAAAESAVTSPATTTTHAEAWALGWAKRGQYFDQLLRDGSLPPNFPTIDNFTAGIATSIKSIDLNAATYQDPARLTYRLGKYISDLAEFDGAEWGDKSILPDQIIGRVVSLAIPKGSMTKLQKAAIGTLREQAKMRNDNSIELAITEF